MATPRARRSRGSNGSLGQLHLSSGEIELYSHQDETARRRCRLLSVREQERRLAQQVTERYRKNLHLVQRCKSKQVQTQQSIERQEHWTELHVRYKSSWQSMGTAQRNARLKLLELLDQAQVEQDKWAYNREVAEKQRVMQAKAIQSHDKVQKSARRRQVQQNMERLRLLSSKQRQEASAQAKREPDKANRRATDRNERERLLQSTEKGVMTSRPRMKDGLSYRFTRTHCLAPTWRVETPSVTVTRHRHSHSTGLRGIEAAHKFSFGMELKKERDRVLRANQETKAVERGKDASARITTQQQGQQAVEWLAFVDQMERRGRMHQAGEDKDDWQTHERRERDNPERVAEQQFAQLLGLEDGSIELSAFSNQMDDDQGLGLVDPDHERVDADTVVEVGNDLSVTKNAAKASGLRIRVETPRRSTSGTDQESGVYLEAPLPAMASRDSPREQLRLRKLATHACEKSAVGKGVTVTSQSGEGLTFEGTKEHVDEENERDNMSSAGQQATGDLGPSIAAASDDRGRHKVEEEHCQGTESAQVANDLVSNVVDGDDTSIEQDDDPLQDRFEHQRCKSLPYQLETTTLLSDVKLHQRMSSFEEVAAGDSPKGSRFNRFSDASDDNEEEKAIVSSNESSRSLVSRGSGIAADQSTSLSVDSASSLAPRGDRSQDEDRQNSRHGSRGVASIERRASRNHWHFSDKSAVQIRTAHDVASPDDTVEGERDSDEDVGCSDGPMSYASGYDHEHDKDVENKHKSLLSKGTAQDKETLDVLAIGGKQSPCSLDCSFKAPAQARKVNLVTSHTRSEQARVHARHYDESQSVTTLGAEARRDKAVDGNSARAIAMEQDERSASKASLISSPASLSRLDPVFKATSRSFQQRNQYQHMTSFSSSDGPSDEDRAETKQKDQNSLLACPTAHASMGLNPYEPYRQQMNHSARRNRTSAASVAQYSLPPSDSQSSLNDSFDRLQSELGDDSFVNELVPLFPTLSSPQSLDTNHGARAHDVRLVAPSLRKRLTMERPTSLRQSRERVGEEKEPNFSRYQATLARTRRAPKNDELSCLETRWSGSIDSDMDATSVTSVEQSPQAAKTRKSHRHARPQWASDHESPLASASDVSSLGFTVQLHLAAGTTRNCKTTEGKPSVYERKDNISSPQMPWNAFDAESENESEQSVASSSSVSMDAHMDYVTNVTSTVGMARPLYLPIPAMMYGQKDMTKPPAPLGWSESSVSRCSTASKADADTATAGKGRDARGHVSRSSSSRRASSDSPLSSPIYRTTSGTRDRKVRSARRSSGRSRTMRTNSASPSACNSRNNAVGPRPLPPFKACEPSLRSAFRPTSSRASDDSRSSVDEQPTPMKSCPRV